MTLGLLAAAAASSSSSDYVYPGVLGFLVVAAMGVALFFLLRSATEAGVDLIAPSDLRAMYEASVARGERLPVSFVVGCHPIDHGLVKRRTENSASRHRPSESSWSFG